VIAFLTWLMVIGSATGFQPDCVQRWSFGGVRPGMLASAVSQEISKPFGNPALRQDSITLQQSSPLGGFRSLVTVKACIDAQGGVSLVTLHFSGSRKDLKADLASLHERWSEATCLWLEVADSFSSTQPTAYFQEVVFSDCGWNALLEWSENRKGMTSLHVGIRSGKPAFVERSGTEYRISHTALREVEAEYFRCRP